MNHIDIVQRVLGDDEVRATVVQRRAERAAAERAAAAAHYIGPDSHGRAIHRGDLVQFAGKVWTVEDSQLRWVVNGMLTAPLVAIGTSQTERL